MTTREFNLIDTINRQGIENALWGVCKDVKSTREFFGTLQDMSLHGKYLYVYCDKDETFFLEDGLAKDFGSDLDFEDGSRVILFDI